MRLHRLLQLWVLGLAFNSIRSDDGYIIGTGIYDVTGPAAQVNLMGYARTEQTAHGIHMRLRSRAFIIGEKFDSVESAESLRAKNDNQSLDPDKAICFVSIDAGMGSDLLTKRVLDRLEELMPPAVSDRDDNRRICHQENLSISGTHTHSASAGFLQYALYQISSYGFVEETMSAYVEGVAQSLIRAYANLQSGSITASNGLLFGANINRSPTSYLLNPENERGQYADEGDTDKNMLLLKLAADDGANVGVISWFSVHGTSMNASNLLLSGDNKGYASYLMEKHYNGHDMLPGQGKFVAAFASTNLGDVSPNTKGPKCIDTGLPCDGLTSTCNGRNELCIASGPGKDIFESTEIIGRKQYEHAISLIQNASIPVRGDVAFRHAYVDMAHREVILDSGDVVHTCPAAMGYSFAAGTTDGPGQFDFAQGTNTSNPFWNMIGGFLSRPSPEQITCQHPKPILLNTGTAKVPYAWDPIVVPLSVFRIGQLFIVSVPGEFTTMAGRRLRNAVVQIATEHGIENPFVTIAGLANTYTGYIVTHEEYIGQRYEAASTLYGPHTLSAYIQEFKRLTRDLLNDKASVSEAAPLDLSKYQVSLLPPVVFDSIRFGRKFGQVLLDVSNEYIAGLDHVIVQFYSANPRNNQKIEGTFLTVDKLNADGSWTTKFVDGDWCTKYAWSGNQVLGTSYADITWGIPSDTDLGQYRICHYGTRKSLFGGTFDFVSSISEILGSYTGLSAVLDIGILSELVGVASSIVKRFSHNWLNSRLTDFEGCSKTFDVKSR